MHFVRSFTVSCRLAALFIDHAQTNDADHEKYIGGHQSQPVIAAGHPGYRAEKHCTTGGGKLDRHSPQPEEFSRSAHRRELSYKRSSCRACRSHAYADEIGRYPEISARI